MAKDKFEGVPDARKISITDPVSGAQLELNIWLATDKALVGTVNDVSIGELLGSLTKDELKALVKRISLREAAGLYQVIE